MRGTLPRAAANRVANEARRRGLTHLARIPQRSFPTLGPPGGSMKALLLAIVSAFVAAACLVHEPPYGVRSSAYSAPVRRCHPSTYWNGDRCVKKGRGHYKHSHHRGHQD